MTAGRPRPHSPAALWNAAAWVSAALLAMADPRLAAVPLAAFAAACLGAVFNPGSRFFLPVISRGDPRRGAVALTFDDGPDAVTTPALLEMLDRHRAAATFFVLGSRAAQHPELVREILRRGHTVGNHSYRHDLLSAFRSPRTTAADIEAAQRVVRDLGAEPLAYRPPMGITSPRLSRALPDDGLLVVNFSCRAWDGGNRRIRDLAGRILRCVRPGDIVLLHERLPDPAQMGHWSGQIERILQGLTDLGLKVVPLAELIGREVMRKTGSKGSRGEEKDAGSRIQDAG